MKPLLLAEKSPLDPIVAERARYAQESSGWRGELELWFAPNAGKTRLMRRRHLGPLAVQKPFHPERDGTCHVYLLHPPGGIAGGDNLDLRFHLEEGARVVLTTPGATKFYRSEHLRSTQSTSMHVSANAICEYLPNETILFDGADADIETRVMLEEGATYVGWDFICLGRPAAKEEFRSGTLRQRIEILRGRKPVWFERVQLAGGSSFQHAPYALAGQTTWGTMVYIGSVAEDATQRVREAIGPQGEARFSVSQLEQGVVCRYLGAKASEGKTLFVRAWDALRISCQGKAASAPRIWAT